MQNRLGAIVSRHDTADRKRETRRKYILGDLALKVARSDPAFGHLLLALIDTHITDARDLAMLAPFIDTLWALPSADGSPAAPSSKPKPAQLRKPAKPKIQRAIGD